MKILLVNKFFYPKGGAEISFFSTAELLEKHGHTLVFFAMQHPQNLPSSSSAYFISPVDYTTVPGVLQNLKTTCRIFYSFEAKQKILQLINLERPDIAHLNNIYHQISPSIIDVLKKAQIPIVMTLRDYKLTCPVYTHLSGNRVCEECRGQRFYRVVVNRCTKNSVMKSIINMLEMYLHHTILHIYNKIDCFIAPSKFLLEKTIQLGFQGRLVHLPNFIDSSRYTPEYQATGNRLVYFGRLSEEKGLTTLLDAIKGLEIQLKIIGEGQQKEQLLNKVKQENISNVTFLGYKTGNELQDEIRQAIAVVLPSEWYENNPRTIIESFALGKPVIGANIGGIPELVVDGQTGYLFQPGNSQDLRQQLIRAVTNKNKLVEMGKQARQLVETELTPEKHYQQLMEVYHEVLHRKGD